MPNVALIPSATANIPALQGEVDGYPDEQHRLETSVGTAPLDDGAEVTDHAVAEPPRLTLTGWVSGFTDAAGASPAEAWAAIQRLHAEVTPVEVFTPWGTYTEMLLARVTATPVGDGMRFRMELQQVLRVGVPAGALIAPRTFDGPAALRTDAVTRGRVATTPVSALASRELTLTSLSDSLPGLSAPQAAATVQSSGLSFSEATQVVSSAILKTRTPRAFIPEVLRHLPDLPAVNVGEVLQRVPHLTPADAARAVRGRPVEDVAAVLPLFPLTTTGPNDDAVPR